MSPALIARQARKHDHEIMREGVLAYVHIRRGALTHVHNDIPLSRLSLNIMCVCVFCDFAYVYV